MKDELLFVVCLTKSGRRQYLLWRDGGDAPDGYAVLPKTGNILAASSLEAILALASKHHLNVSTRKPQFIDLDLVFGVLSRLRPSRRVSKHASEVLLECWNALEDLARSAGVEPQALSSDPGHVNKIYEKLFLGNNLPAMKEGEREYQPHLDRDELFLLRRLLRDMDQKIDWSATA